MNHINYELETIKLPKGANLIISHITGLNKNTISRSNTGYNKSLFTRKRIKDTMQAIEPFMALGALPEEIISWHCAGFSDAEIKSFTDKGITDEQFYKFNQLRPDSLPV